MRKWVWLKMLLSFLQRHCFRHRGEFSVYSTSNANKSPSVHGDSVNFEFMGHSSITTKRAGRGNTAPMSQTQNSLSIAHRAFLICDLEDASAIGPSEPMKNGECSIPIAQ